MKRASPLAIGCLALFLIAEGRAAEPGVPESCSAAIERTEAEVQALPENDPLRRDVEYWLRQGRAEEGSGDPDECLEDLEHARQLLQNGERETPGEL